MPQLICLPIGNVNQTLPFYRDQDVMLLDAACVMQWYSEAQPCPQSLTPRTRTYFAQHWDDYVRSEVVRIAHHRQDRRQQVAEIIHPHPQAYPSSQLQRTVLITNALPPDIRYLTNIRNDIRDFVGQPPPVYMRLQLARLGQYEDLVQVVGPHPRIMVRPGIDDGGDDRCIVDDSIGVNDRHVQLELPAHQVIPQHCGGSYSRYNYAIDHCRDRRMARQRDNRSASSALSATTFYHMLDQNPPRYQQSSSNGWYSCPIL